MYTTSTFQSNFSGKPFFVGTGDMTLHCIRRHISKDERSGAVMKIEADKTQCHVAEIFNVF